MKKKDFERLVAGEFPRAIPERFLRKMRNVGFVVEDEPSPEVRLREGLSDDETLLGLYQGIPISERGESYGIGPIVPDVITLYRLPILEAAETDVVEIKKVIRDTIWHEVAHHFGFSEDEVRHGEKKRDNGSGQAFP